MDANSCVAQGIVHHGAGNCAVVIAYWCMYDSSEIVSYVPTEPCKASVGDFYIYTTGTTDNADSIPWAWVSKNAGKSRRPIRLWSDGCSSSNLQSGHLKSNIIEKLCVLGHSSFVISTSSSNLVFTEPIMSKRSGPLTPGIAFITGGARGLGNAIAVSFAKEGAEGVVLVDIQDENTFSEGRKNVEAYGTEVCNKCSCFASRT